MKQYYAKSSIINYKNIIIIIFLRKIFTKILFLYLINNKNISELNNIIQNKYFRNFKCDRCLMNNYKFLFNENIDIFQCEYCNSYSINKGTICNNTILTLSITFLSSYMGIRTYRLDINNDY